MRRYFAGTLASLSILTLFGLLFLACASGASSRGVSPSASAGELAPTESSASASHGSIPPAAPALPPAGEAALREALALRAKAIVEKDKALYMSLLDQADAEFLLEQSRWFDYRLSAELFDYTLEAESLQAAGEGEALVILRQSYRIGLNKDERLVRFVDRYRVGADAWRYADLAFAPLETEHFIVNYALPPEALGDSKEARTERLRGAEKVARHAEKAWATIRASYGETPPDKTVIKLFADRELLRQNSKIILNRLFNGWGEPGESLKLWLNPDPKRDFSSVIAHELIHKVTLTTASNLCSWFAEGLANCLGSFPAMGGSYLDGGFHKASDYDRGIAWLEAFDPDLVDNDADWWIYGGMAGTVVRFMVETWGADAPRRLVRALADYRQPERGYVYSLHDAAYRADLAGAIAQTCGVDMLEFDRLWRDWIRRK